MSLLELITKASTNQETQPPQSAYQINLTDSILTSLKPQQQQDSEPIPLIKRVVGWEITDADTKIIEFGNEFTKKLKRKFKNKDEFLTLFNSFLEKNRAQLNLSNKMGTKSMVRKLKFIFTPSIAALVIEACVGLEIWELIETLIVEGVVGRFTPANLIESLVEKKQANLVCLCVRHFTDIEFSDVQCMLKYFLSAQSGMMSVRKNWEREAILASGKVNGDLDLDLPKQAAVLMMVAYDAFTSAELCLHYLVASSQLDELKLKYSLGGLSGGEMLKLVRYFGKWVKKYLKFPQAGPCPEAATVLGLELCDWVPSVEAVVKYLGLVLDLQFSSLVLYKDFHDELRSLDEDVKSLAAEARFCCSVVDVLDNLKA